MPRIYVIGGPKGKAAQLAQSLGAELVFSGPMEAGNAIFIDDMTTFATVEADVAKVVRQAARAVFLNLDKGKYRIGGGHVVVGGGGAGLHFVSEQPGTGSWQIFARTTSSSGTTPSTIVPRL